MTYEILYTLIHLVIQQAAYVASITWVAWHYERRSGLDAFHLMLPFVLGVVCTWYFSVSTEISFFIAALVGAFSATGSDAILTFTTNKRYRLPLHISLLFSIVITVTTLAIFEFSTGYQPLTIRYGDFASLTYVTVLFLIGLTFISIWPFDPYMDELLLGVQGRNIAQGWRQLRLRPRFISIIVYLASWFIAVAIPIATTGITSYRLLRDIVISLVVVRLIGARKSWLIIPVSLSIAFLRVSVSYIAVGDWAATLAEASFIALVAVTSRVNVLSRKWSDMRV